MGSQQTLIPKSQPGQSSASTVPDLRALFTLFTLLVSLK